MIETCAGLSPDVLESIAALESRVVAADGGRLKLEWGSLRERPTDRRQDVLAWDGTTLTGFAGLHSFDGTSLEIAGMVDPLCRRAGIGSALLAATVQLAGERGFAEALLVCPRTTGAGAAFARQHGGTLDHCEHALVLTGAPEPGRSDPRTVLRPAVDGDRARIGELLASGLGIPNAAATLDDGPRHVAVERDGALIGYLRTTLVDGQGGIYGFVIDAGLRGRGIGRDVLRRCCVELFDRGASGVGLEVAADNDAALGLYTSIGFAPVITEDYFRVAVSTG